MNNFSLLNLQELIDLIVCSLDSGSAELNINGQRFPLEKANQAQLAMEQIASIGKLRTKSYDLLIAELAILKKLSPKINHSFSYLPDKAIMLEYDSKLYEITSMADIANTIQELRIKKKILFNTRVLELIYECQKLGIYHEFSLEYGAFVSFSACGEEFNLKNIDSLSALLFKIETNIVRKILRKFKVGGKAIVTESKTIYHDCICTESYQPFVKGDRISRIEIDSKHRTVAFFSSVDSLISFQHLI